MALHTSYQATVKVYGSKDGKTRLEQSSCYSSSNDSTSWIRNDVQNSLKEIRYLCLLLRQDSMNKIKYMTKEAHVSEMRMADSTDNSMAKTKKNDGQPILPNTGKAQTATAGLGMFGLVFGRSCWTFRFDNQTRRLRFKSI